MFGQPSADGKVVAARPHALPDAAPGLQGPVSTLAAGQAACAQLPLEPGESAVQLLLLR